MVWPLYFLDEAGRLAALSITNPAGSNACCSKAAGTSATAAIADSIAVRAYGDTGRGASFQYLLPGVIQVGNRELAQRQFFGRFLFHKNNRF